MTHDNPLNTVPRRIVEISKMPPGDERDEAACSIRLFLGQTVSVARLFSAELEAALLPESERPERMVMPALKEFCRTSEWTRPSE